jgi:PAS domain S-box-containing protein
MYGYSAKEAVGKSIAILIPADLPEELRRTLESVRRGEAIQHYETRRRRKDGTIIDVSLTVSPVKDGSGTTVGASAIAQDITGRKKMEDAMKESEARWRTYFDLGVVGMVIETPEGGWIAANDRACDMFGYSREELFKKHWTELTHPDDLSKDEDTLYPQLLRGEIEKYSIEKRFIRKNGQPLDVIISVGCTRDAKGKADQVFGFVVDITERKRAEEELRRSEDKYRSLVENINDAVFALDSSGHFTYMSPVVEPILGYSADEMTGQHFSRFIHPEDLEAVAASFQHVLNGVSEPSEFRVLKKDGMPSYVRASSRPLIERTSA